VQPKSDMSSGKVPEQRSSVALFNKLKVNLATIKQSARKTMRCKVKRRDSLVKNTFSNAYNKKGP